MAVRGRPPSDDDHDHWRAYCEFMGMPYVPGFVSRQPTIDESGGICPHCMYVITPPPKKSAECPKCGDRFWVRTTPTGFTKTMTRSAMIETDCLWAEINAVERSAVITVTGGVSVAERSEEAKQAADEARRVTQYIARARTLHKHGRGPWVDEQGNIAPSPTDGAV